MRTILFLAVLFVGSALFPLRAQEKPGLLYVTGQAEINVQPDEVEARFLIELIRMDYGQTVEAAGREADKLAGSLARIGYERDQIKTTSFNVSKNYVYHKNQRTDSGYVAHQSLQIEFPYDPDKIVQLINTISSSSGDPQLNLNFRLSDSRSAEIKDKLISMAVADARAKAEIIAGSAGVTISGIEEIHYGSPSQPGPQMFRMSEASVEEDSPGFGGFNVQPITFNESIQISYRISSD